MKYTEGVLGLQLIGVVLALLAGVLIGAAGPEPNVSAGQAAGVSVFVCWSVAVYYASMRRRP